MSGTNQTIAINSLTKKIDRDLYDKDGFFDIAKVKCRIHVKTSFFSKALNKTSRAIEKNPRKEDVQEFLRNIVYILTLLNDILPDQKDQKIWLTTKDRELSGKAPVEFIAEGKTQIIIDYIEDIQNGALT